MQLIRDLTEKKTDKTVLCIGVFDGLHLGHQALIQVAKEQAKKLGANAALLSFEPYPQAYFAKLNSHPLIPRLMRLRDKFLQLQKWGMDILFALRFDSELAALSGEAFVKRVLVDKLNVAAIVVGDDFRFGHKRACGVKELAQFAMQYGFELHTIPDVLVEKDKRFSSSLLRECLKNDDFVQLQALLGRPYSLSGCVRPGDGRGRQIGVPTANVQVPDNALPLDGVYVVEAVRPNGECLRGVANIGRQPTFLGEKKRIEVHAFDFDEQTYGEYWEVIIRKKIRGVKKFSGIDELIAQIKQDMVDGRRYFLG